MPYEWDKETKRDLLDYIVKSGATKENFEFLQTLANSEIITADEAGDTWKRCRGIGPDDPSYKDSLSIDYTQYVGNVVYEWDDDEYRNLSKGELLLALRNRIGAIDDRLERLELRLENDLDDPYFHLNEIKHIKAILTEQSRLTNYLAHEK